MSTLILLLLSDQDSDKRASAPSFHARAIHVPMNPLPLAMVRTGVQTYLLTTRVYALNGIRRAHESSTFKS